MLRANMLSISTNSPSPLWGEGWGEGQELAERENGTPICRFFEHQPMPTANHRARNLRRSQTEAEEHLWSFLRNRTLMGHKFRRQHPVGRYIVDFVSLSG